MDYTIFYKSSPAREQDIETLGEWDIFLSAYNQTERVNSVFEKANSKEKHWLLHTEYGFTDAETPKTGLVFKDPGATSESIFISNFFKTNFFDKGIKKEDLKTKKICIDSTGFIRPHLMYLVLYLYKNGIEIFDVLYSEPSHYAKKEKTEFSKGATEKVRFVDGFSGALNRELGGDLLIIGAGFDHALISEVADDKLHANKVKIVGFPSLQPDMYQQSRIRINEAEENFLDKKPYFAPANDPFVTANVISDIVKTQNAEKKITNLYLSPLGTKAQTLGFVLFYIGECIGKTDGGIIFPFSQSYSKETSKGIAKIWRYTVEFPLA